MSNKSYETPLILALETSCDETAAALVRGRQVISGAVSSQIEDHVPYGGVVPEIASRKHIEALIPVTEEAMMKAGVCFNDIDAVAVTYAPGLIGALLCGLSFAKGLALSRGVPLIGVHHIEAHISANYIAFPDMEPPFACLVVSGGHSHLIRVNDYGSYRLLRKTRDDAAGEAFDKAARVLGLPYPGGPHLDRLAKGGDDTAVKLTKPKAGEDFSFSGLKSSLIQTLARMEKAGIAAQPQDIAASFRRAVVEELLDGTFDAMEREGLKTLALAGGVACNSLLRAEALRRGADAGFRVIYPPPSLCTDNAEMVGCAASHLWRIGKYISVKEGLGLNAIPSLSIEEYSRQLGL